MKFLELNKKRHATKHFTDKPVDPKDVRTAIEIATLAPSGLINDVNRRLEDKELKVVLTDAAKDFVVEHGFDPMYGARPLKRYYKRWKRQERYAINKKIKK